MILTTKSRYAIIVLADIAMQNNELVSVKDICNRQGVPARYAEQICAKLVKAALLQSFKGPGGGYKLASPPANITIMQVLTAVGEVVHMTKCHSNDDGCMNKKGKCAIHNLLSGLGNQVKIYLSNCTIGDIINQNRTIQISDIKTSPEPQQFS